MAAPVRWERVNEPRLGASTVVSILKERKNRYVNTVVRLTVDGHTQFKHLLRTLNRVAGQ